MGMESLSRELLALGFVPVLHSTEFQGGPTCGIPAVVKHGTPGTWDANNGVLAVYDEKGRPWVTLRRRLAPKDVEAVDGLIRDCHLTQGAWVPHSNDGGWFLHEVLPNEKN